ncbi:hypothetical protein Ga0100231_024535 [Opitutaceae bacterium TAV4]|nr:hypothetical protein Ga0100231_024535 [Opitutaceae bacterium TAV4]RRK00865.1 hypothetical protein Ga0100230_024100 [Opitutaceae bacterium TAV3]
MPAGANMSRNDPMTSRAPPMRNRDRKSELSYALKRQALWSVSSLVALLIGVGIIVTMQRPESAEKMWDLLGPIISMAIGGILVYVGSAKSRR